MDFHFTEEQKILQKTARDFLQSECPSSFVLEMEADEKGYTPELWNKMAELGLSLKHTTGWGEICWI